MRNRIPILIVLLFLQILFLTYMTVFGHQTTTGIVALSLAMPATICVLAFDLVDWVNQIVSQANEE